MTTARIRPFAGLCQFRIGIGQDPFRFDHVTARRAPRLTGTSTSMVCAANMTMRVQAGCGQSALVRPSWCHTRLPQGCVRQANAQLQYLGSCYYCECYPHPACMPLAGKAPAPERQRESRSRARPRSVPVRTQSSARAALSRRSRGRDRHGGRGCGRDRRRRSSAGSHPVRSGHGDLPGRLRVQRSAARGADRGREACAPLRWACCTNGYDC